MIRSFNGNTPRIHSSAFISEAAYIVGDVEIGKNVSIWPGAVIRGDLGKISLGRDSAVEDNAVIHSGTPGQPTLDVVIGERVIIGHGAVLNCRSVGSRVLIGMNATLLHEAVIGNDCIIAGGCVVGHGMTVPDGSFVAGVPGKIKGTPSERQLWWTREGFKGYVELAGLHKAEGMGEALPEES